MFTRKIYVDVAIMFHSLEDVMYERTHHVRISFSGGKFCRHAGRFLLRVVAASELL